MQRTVIVPALLAAVLLSACGSVRISRITADPTRYRNRTVRVSGTVVTGIGVFGAGGYQIDDGTGKLYVLSKTGIPSKGSRVTVTGSVTGGANIPGIPAGIVLRERSHKVK